MQEAIKNFIEKHIELIETKNWVELYNTAQSEISARIGQLSYALLLADINPLYDLDRVLPWMFCACSDLKELIIPDNVRMIKRRSFHDCFNLEKIVLPATIEFIDSTAFTHCYALENVTYGGTIQQWQQLNVDPSTFKDIISGEIRCYDGSIPLGRKVV